MESCVSRESLDLCDTYNGLHRKRRSSHSLRHALPPTQDVRHCRGPPLHDLSLRLCARTPLSLSSSVVGLATPDSWARGRIGAPRVRRLGARSRRRGIPRVCLKRRQSAPGHVLLLDPHGVCDALLEGGHDPRHLRVLGKVVVQRVVDSVRVPLLHAGQDLFAPAFVRTQFRAEDPHP